VSLERLWADWRAEYVANAGALAGPEGCVMCNLVRATDDAEALVLERTGATITVMNLFPYGSGHLMVAPVRHVASYVDLDEDENVAIARAQVRALRAVNAAYKPDGANLGANLGRAAGAGVPGHLHVHVLPRWNGDTNFMTVVGQTRVLAEELPQTALKLRPVFARLAETS
jgi:ATP adenylyltransferase